MAADPPENSGTRRSAAGAGALDRPPARVAAFGVFLLAVGARAWLHRDDIFPPEAVPADDPVALCVAGRWAGIDEMVADGTVGYGPRRALQCPRRGAVPDPARSGPGAAHAAAAIRPKRGDSILFSSDTGARAARRHAQGAYLPSLAQ